MNMIAWAAILLISCTFSACSESDPGRSASTVTAQYLSSEEESFADSIFRLLHQNPEAARKKSMNMMQNNPDLSLALQSELLKHIGTSYSIEAQFDKALQYYNESLDIAQREDHLKLIADLKNNIGLVNRSIGNFKNAFMFFYEASTHYEDLGDEQGQANAQNNTGLLYRDLDNFEKAKVYLEKARDGFTLTADTIGITIALNNLSLIYAHYNDFEKAFELLNQTIAMAESSNNHYSLTISHRAKGNTYLHLGDLDQALKSFRKSKTIATNSNQPHQVAQSMLGVSKTLLAMDAYDEALEIAKRAMEIGLELNSDMLQNDARGLLSEIHKKNGDYRKSLDYYTAFIETKEEMLNQTTIHQIYDFEITSLNQANQLQQFELESKELAISKKNNILFFITVLFVISLAGLYFFYHNHRNRQRLKLQQTIIEFTEKKSLAAVEAEFQERKRIGQELHDGLGQLLSVAGLNISVLQKKKEMQESRRQELLSAVMSSVDEAFSEVRNISHNLAPSLLSERGLKGALKNLADQVNQSKQLQLRFETFELNEHLSNLVENTLFRAIQEILNNAIKHSRASELNIQITQGQNEITLMAEDNGVGFEVEKVQENGGHGLTHMKTRIENLNGSIHIDSNPARGTIISIVIPLKPGQNVT